MVQPTESVKFSRPPVALRAWHDPHHDLDTVLQLGFCKKATGRLSVTYPKPSATPSA